MEILDMTKRHPQQGFTLVELAIVLTIIGLLIGGILKGQQLMQNARITSTISQLNAIQSANTTFRDTYGSYAGDMPNADTRVPNCTKCVLAVAATAGDNIIGAANWDMTTFKSTSFGGAAGTVDNETVLYWLELSKAGLLAGITDDGVNSIAASFGGSLPKAKVDGGFTAGFASGSATIQGRPAALPLTLSGLVVTLSRSPATLTSTSGLQVLTASSAAQIDRKMDDGQPATGSVQAYGFATSCYSVVAPASATSPAYLESIPTNDCGLYFLIGN